MPWKSLKHALLFNAVGTALLGVLMIVDASVIAGLAGAHAGAIPPLICTLAGAVFLVFAADLAFVGTRKPIPQGMAKLLTLADVAFVIAIPVVMLAASPWLSNLGQILLADLALLTAFLAWCQWRGLRQPKSAPASS
ncbi:MAG TPA: hypothetical protein VFX91_09695 [Alcanivorax sp.]|nr:hypothetical protein [Alcanivorax sp.]